MLKIGCHLSSAKGYLAMGQEALSIGANTFQFFTRNPRGGKAKPLNIEDMRAFGTFAKENQIPIILAHAPYTMNACARDEGLREFARDMMEDDLSRLEYIPGSMYNFHPGSHVQQGAEAGIELVSGMLNAVLRPEQSTTVLLETMAGKGTEVGRSFEELRAIIDRVEVKEKLGVCLDTCHVYDGGYDIVNHLDEVMTEFDQIVGLDRLRAIHLNGSMNTLGSHKDRHEKLGYGDITVDAIRRIVNHESLRKLPFYLETPNDLAGYAREIDMVKQMYIAD